MNPTKKQVNGSHYKESDGKLNYELDWYFIESIARRMQKNKGKYEPYNWQKQTDIEPIKQALIRHCISVFNNAFADGDDELGHIEAIALNAMFIWHQLRNYGK